MLIGLVAGEGGEEEQSHSKVGTLLGPTTKAKIKQAFKKMLITCFRIANLTLESCYV